MFQPQIDNLNAKIINYNPQRKVLRDLDIFVLDNSIRDNVGQLRGHTIEDKWNILNEVKKVGFKHIFVESFSHRSRLGDTFIQQLQDQGEDMSNYFAYSELIDTIDEDKVPVDEIPIGLQKMKTYGINNVMLEFDLDHPGIDYSKFDALKMCDLITQKINWIRDNLSPHSLIFLNIRDFSECMNSKPRRIFAIVSYLSSLPEDKRIFGLACEDRGNSLPEEMAVWIACVRKQMNRCGWDSGHLLVHIHEKWGMCNVVQLECLANGATGIWAGLSEEGASMGHASSCLTIMNLIRMGNKKVLQKFNCAELRSASQIITKITTGKPPHPKQPVCGDRAVEVVFTLMSKQEDFSVSQFFDKKREIRVSTMATPEMIVKKLKERFGENVQFTEEIASRMIDTMLDDLRENRKEEYTSTVGLAVLFDKSGGKLTEAMAKAVEKDEDEETEVHVKWLMDQIRHRWDFWDCSDGVKDDQVEFIAFYNGFMAPYFSSYRSESTQKALQAIDMDRDGNIDWNEFSLYLKWAARQYPETETPEELISIAFIKGIVPAMQDEVLNTTVFDNVFDGDENFYPIRKFDDDSGFFIPQHKLLRRISSV